jgi:hypothetical protein
MMNSHTDNKFFDSEHVDFLRQSRDSDLDRMERRRLLETHGELPTVLKKQRVNHNLL